MAEYPLLPSPLETFGVDGVMVDRTARSLELFVGAILTHATLKALRGQFRVIEASDPIFTRIVGANKGLMFVPGDR